MQFYFITHIRILFTNHNTQFHTLNMQQKVLFRNYVVMDTKKCLIVGLRLHKSKFAFKDFPSVFLSEDRF